MKSLKARYDAVLFDLDGTLTDSQEGIKRCLVYALQKLNITGYDKLELSAYIGPPLYQTLIKFGLSDEKAREGVKYYRERYAEKGLFENELYPGIESLLSELAESGAYIAIATTKAEVYAKAVAEYFHIDKYFSKIAGPSLDDTASEKVDIIKRALPENYQNAVMIGDRHFDVDGARAAGISSVGVLYGFGERDEIEACKPDKIVSSVQELGDFLLPV